MRKNITKRSVWQQERVLRRVWKQDYLVSSRRVCTSRKKATKVEQTNCVN